MKLWQSNQLFGYFPERLQNLLEGFESYTVNDIREIRIRKNAPISFSIAQNQYFADERGNLSVKIVPHPFTVTETEFQEVLDKITDYSFFSHTEEILNGFITLPEGHRIGICGSALYNNGALSGMADINTLIFRIARKIDGVSSSLIKTIFEGGLKGTVIAGEPSSGKTTLIRDMAVQLSSGATGKSYSVALIDERYEIAGRKRAGNTFEILSGFKKATGILQAVRTLSPNVIICDELGSVAETKAVISGFNSGVPVITTIHASDLKECVNKPQLRMLAKHAAFEYLVLLEGRDAPSKIKKIMKRNELEYEMDRHSNCDNVSGTVWRI